MKATRHTLINIIAFFGLFISIVSFILLIYLTISRNLYNLPHFIISSIFSILLLLSSICLSKKINIGRIAFIILLGIKGIESLYKIYNYVSASESSRLVFNIFEQVFVILIYLAIMLFLSSKTSREIFVVKT